MPTEFDNETLHGHLAAQNLALQGAREIASFLRVGWSEKQAAKLLNTWLCDNGVRGFFHYAYAWFGERSRFRGMRVKNYFDFMPSSRVLCENEPYILDVAPIVNGYVADIGYSNVMGKNEEFETAQTFLQTLKTDIVQLFKTQNSGADIWRDLETKIKDAGYDCIHRLYPLSVLGHRVYKNLPAKAEPLKLFNFGWQSYWSIFSRGIFGELLNPSYKGPLDGLWAIEPHIGTQDFGLKFEEILVVEGANVRWLSQPETMESL